MADDTSDLLAQAQAIQHQKLNSPEGQLLAQAQKIQKQKINAAKATQSPEFSAAQSAGIGALHGVTGGLSGAIAGAGNALGGLLGGGATQSAADESIGLRPDLAAKPSKVPDYHPSYKEGLNDQVAMEKAAHDQNPGSYNSAEFAGSILPTMTGGAALKGAGMTSNVAQGATLGAGLGLTSYVGENADPTLTGAAGATAVGAGLGAAGGKLGDVIAGKLNPENLEVAGSKMASKAVGIKPSKELTTEFNEDTGKNESGSKIINGIGKTLMDQNALPMIGGADAIHDSTLSAIENNYKKLNPLLNSAQEKLNPILQSTLDDVRPISLKTADLMQSMSDQIPDTSGKHTLMQKLSGTYDNYVQKLSQADGNLQALNGIKRELQAGAKDLAKNVYNQGSDASWEATLLKRLGGITRQHIEDLANAADQGAGDAIHQVNGNIQLLNTALPYVQKLGDKPVSKVGLGELGTAGAAVAAGHPLIGLGLVAGKAAIEHGTGNPIGRLSKMAGAKFLNNASNVETGVGTLVQKVLPQVPKAITVSPWSQEKAQKASGLNGENPKQNVTRTASNLYNATNESLSDVAEQLKTKAGMGPVADYLKKAVDENDQGAKNRAIFSILQNPNSRKLLTPENEEENV